MDGSGVNKVVITTRCTQPFDGAKGSSKSNRLGGASRESTITGSVLAFKLESVGCHASSAENTSVNFSHAGNICKQGSKKLKIAQRGAKRIGSTALKGYDPYYYKFQESGFTSPSGRKIEGRGFIQKAFESNKYRVINTISDYVIAEVKKQKAKNA